MKLQRQQSLNRHLNANAQSIKNTKPLAAQKTNGSFLHKENHCSNVQANNYLTSYPKEAPKREVDYHPYMTSIIQHMRQNYQSNLPRTNPVKNQKEINSSMKSILTNWLFEIHHKFKLKTRTVFLASNIIDRYMENKQIKRKEFQLLGIASFLVASKFEDIYPPESSDLCYLCENAYDQEQLFRMESQILSLFNFDLIFVSVLDILEQFFFTLGIKQIQIQQMSVLVAKLFLFSSHVSKYNPYKLAAFAMEESFRLLGYKSKKVYNIISDQESDVLQQKLGKIIKKSSQQGLNSLQHQEAAFFQKVFKKFS